jgi:mono/diheme cytochrome c family protein
LRRNLIGKIVLQIIEGVNVTIKTASLGLLLTISLMLAMRGSVRAQNQTEGKNLYTTYCASCHGDKGKGDGAAAMGLPQRPADHTNGQIMNKLSDKFLTEVISKGGGAVGKSTFMPSWGTALNEKQIRDIVGYIRTMAVPPYKGEVSSNK